MTWNKRMIVAIVCVSVSYGIWFDWLDSLPGIGNLFGGDLKYQPWNIIGHFIPALFLLLIDFRKIEFFLAAFLISTAVMDLPNWAAERIAHGGFLWLQHGNTYSIARWTAFYYNPIGTYGIWGGAFPTAMVMFWSIVARLLGAGLLIWYQTKIEKEVGYNVPLLRIYGHVKVIRDMERRFDKAYGLKK